jgi:hypothetical protein
VTDPRTSAPPPEDDAPRDEPVVDSFAAEPEPQLPDPDAAPVVVEPQVPLDAPEPATPQTLADEEPVEPVEAPVEPVEPTEPVVDPAVVEDPPPLEEAPVEPEPVVDPAVVEDPPPLEDAPVEPEPAPEPEPAAVPGAQAAGSRTSWLPVVVLGTIVGLLLGGTGFAAYEWFDRRGERADLAREQEQIDAASTAAMAAATEAATALFSYSHENLADDFEKGLAFTTGEFQEEYRRTTQEVVTPVAERYDAVVVAQVSDVGVVRATPDEVTALVFLNQVTTSTRVTGQQVDQSRVRMRLVERDGRWLVEEVDAL